MAGQKKKLKGTRGGETRGQTRRLTVCASLKGGWTKAGTSAVLHDLLGVRGMKKSRATVLDFWQRYVSKGKWFGRPVAGSCFAGLGQGQQEGKKETCTIERVFRGVLQVQ